MFALLLVTVFFTARAADSALPAGTAKGTCAKDGEAAVTLAYAGAFVDQKEDDKHEASEYSGSVASNSDGDAEDPKVDATLYAVVEK